MRNIVILGAALLAWSGSAFASELDCAIGGVYENKNGELVQRPARSAIGESLKIDLDTGIVSGYFETDGDAVEVIPVSSGFLSIETASGLYGNSANRLRVAPVEGEAGKHTFTYNKNWLVISGVCAGSM